MTDIIDCHDTNEEKASATVQVLTSPAELINEFPCTPAMEEFITKKRHEIADVINGKDDRLLVVIGPCSIHNIEEGLDYASKLSEAAKKYESTLLVSMRVYLEKPRTTVGWKGLLYDPHLDGSSNIDQGLRTARQLLIAVNEMGLPCSSEFLQPMIVQYVADLVSWVAIGARTTESQIHRELVSGLDTPVGFKNGTTGSVESAVNACVSSQKSHASFAINDAGKIVCFYTSGNDDVHVILRGGTDTGPNYSSEHVHSAQELLDKNKLKSGIMIDCSHGNALQDCEKQKEVIGDVCKQVGSGDLSIMGVMIESNLVGGRQSFVEGKKHLLDYGKSITDTCISWEDSLERLGLLSEAVAQRRTQHANDSKN